MIKHIVMFKLKNAADAALIKETADKMLPSIPTLRGFETRINSKDAPESNFEFVLICDFDDIDGLNAYQVHPDHKKFGAFITPLRTDNGRACIDYEY